MERRPRGLVGFRWGRGDELVVFKTQVRGRLTPAQREEGKARAKAGLAEERVENEHRVEKPDTVHVISWDQTPAQMRRLVAAGQREFVALQDAGADVLACSRNLRSELDRAVQTLEAAVDKRQDDPRAGYLERMKDAAAAWHLTELLILDPEPLVASDFVSWVAQHGPWRDPTGELDVKNRGIESGYYWKEVFSCAIRGDLLAAWRCLRLLEPDSVHSAADDALLAMLDELRALLLAMPRRAVSGRGLNDEEGDVVRDADYELWRSAEMGADPDSMIDFKARWMRWREAMQVFARDYAAAVAQVGPELQDFLQLILGNVEVTLRRIDAEKDSWYHLVACFLQYHVTAARKQELGALVKQSIDALDLEVDARVHLLLTVVNLDAPGILQQLHSTVGDRWVTAHLAELLARCGALETVMDPASIEASGFLQTDDFLLGDLEVDLREFFVLEYAASLGLGGQQSDRAALAPGAWRLTASYLSALTRKVQVPPGVELPLGLLHMQAVVDLQRPVSDRFCHRLAKGCQMMGLSASSLARQRIMHWWRFRGGLDNGLQGLSNALVWASTYGEQELAERMLARLFAVSRLDVLDALVDHLAASAQLTQTLKADALAFLARYRAVHETIRAARANVNAHVDEADQNDEILASAYSQATAQLADAFAANLVPRSFCVPLLKKVFFESQRRPQLSAAHAATLIAALEEVEIAHDRNDLLKGVEAEDLAGLRTMLVQCMALAPIVSRVK
ncbi:Nuclear pore complex protein Nup85 [Hondaea fermentalgiana]|uniref:Nuclear pore complex protein Nup85 n=1 Tax=Hondaea fermentalgiana TaxID=2315210 RepID=A0A2R5GIN8_9STRA|nr:Nuclear pore complex protein Nup85 [Hondaea fermentalgiana]|eukprot:GBG30757.1 Nuclear pore complex protein Nup85 [Hondaea fermentalgiana]